MAAKRKVTIDFTDPDVDAAVAELIKAATAPLKSRLLAAERERDEYKLAATSKIEALVLAISQRDALAEALNRALACLEGMRKHLEKCHPNDTAFSWERYMYSQRIPEVNAEARAALQSFSPKEGGP
jgi:hypothetical protein